MRTNVFVDDELMKECRRLSGLKTKKEIISAALTEYANLLKRRQLLKYYGKVTWQGNLDEMRSL